MSAPRLDLIIAGGGLAGCLAALALSTRRPELNFLLVEECPSFGGNHIWSFFDSDVADQDREWLRQLESCHWPDHEVRFPKRRRVLGLRYNSVRSKDLDKLVRQQLRAGQYRLGSRIETLGRDNIVVDGERIEANGIIDARGAGPAPLLDLAWQKFVGRTYLFDETHEQARPIIMDAEVDQRDGYRFIYSLPLSAREMMIEDTYYSANPTLDRHSLGSALDDLAGARGRCTVIGEETGVLPIVLSGEIEALWPNKEPPVARLGMRG